MIEQKLFLKEKNKLIDYINSRDLNNIEIKLLLMSVHEQINLQIIIKSINKHLK